MQGFKSFARKTEILFENSMNVIVGPNGSGKSNITDALCFVLGRMSIKSIRAAKAANLIFSGNKQYKASQESFVELVFDNADKTFALDTEEVIIKRLVRRNGLSIYKINNETKTRQELIELLAQAGIDPHGFNIVLQGEISSLVKMTSEERRKIIEDVAGISIYETRKHKSLRELEKSDEKLKEVSAVLREKNNYLKNLEKDREDALNYKKIELTIKRCKATIFSKNIKEKERDSKEIQEKISKEKSQIQKVKREIEDRNKTIKKLEEKIITINQEIQRSTSDKQEKLHAEISDLKSNLAALQVRKENFENRLQQNSEKIKNLKQKNEMLDTEIKEIKTRDPEVKKNQQKATEIQEELDSLEKSRRKFYLLKSEISTLENQREETQRTLLESRKEINIIESDINNLFENLKQVKSPEKAESLQNEIEKKAQDTRESLIDLEEKILELEKENAILNETIKREKIVQQNIPSSGTCPLCKTKITEEHISHVITYSNTEIKNAGEKIRKNLEEKEQLHLSLSKLRHSLEEKENQIREIQSDIYKIKNSEDKKEQIKKLSSIIQEAENQVKEINIKLSSRKKEFSQIENIEEKYDETRLKLQDLSFVDLDLDSESAMKKRELEKNKTDFKILERDSEDTTTELRKILEKLEKQKKLAEKKEIEEKELYDKFEKMFAEKTEIQDQQKAVETTAIGFQHEIKNYENQIQNYSITAAQINAQLETIQEEFSPFKEVELLSGTKELLQERQRNLEIRLAKLGSINMRAVEIYDQVKEQCRLIEEKVQTIDNEKEKILKIIEEIDKKKRKSFLKTLDAVNQYFTRNFTQLSKKGEVFLDLENKKDPFAGGLNILVKVARGKYFDVTSLSGGEKTLIALSLIFAIQEYRPYCFYIFDEIDAALDKHNSELLAALIKKYMLSGQYIVVTHNDALISEATTLYGISMQENISKVISLKI